MSVTPQNAPDVLRQALAGTLAPEAPETPETGAAAAPPADLLLACLKFVAGHYNLSTSDAVLTAGLPLAGRPLDPELFVRAAARVRLNATMKAAVPGALDALELPAVVLLKSGGAVVVRAIEPGRGFHLFVPEAGGMEWKTAAELNALSAGRVILVKPVYRLSDAGSLVMGAPADGHWFWGAARRHWRTYWQFILAACVVNLLAVVVPIFTMQIYDRVIPNEALSTLWVLAAGVACALVFDFLLKFARAMVVDHAARRLDLVLSSTLFEKIMGTRLTHRPATTGSFATRVGEYELVRDFFTSNTIGFAVDLVFVVLFLGVIAMLGGWIVLIPFFAFILVAAAGYVVYHLIADEIRRSQAEAALRYSLLVESVAAIETIKSVRAEGYMLRRWENLTRSAAATSERIRLLSAVAFNFAGFVQQLVTVGIMIAGVYMFAGGAITVGAIVATTMLAGRTVGPLGQLALILTRARHAFLAMENLEEIMSRPDELVSPQGFVHRTIANGKVEFRKVAFSYPETTHKILDGFNLTIRPGERVGVIGRIGAGKTTVGRLMSGLYQPTEGEVLVDDVDIRQYHPHELRTSVALVVQDADLFFGTVKENIAMADPDADEAQILRAARLAGVDEFVARHPLGYDMPVGEKGNRLSGGQRQAVCLARALLGKPKVIFLDEPSSAMDMATEKQLIQRLREAVAPDQTLIISTHRYSMLELVDRLIVVDRGMVVADGPKEKVMEALARNRRPSNPEPVAPSDPQPAAKAG